MKLEFSRQVFEKYSSTHFHENKPSDRRLVPCGRIDMTKIVVALRNFVNALQNSNLKILAFSGKWRCVAEYFPAFLRVVVRSSFGSKTSRIIISSSSWTPLLSKRKATSDTCPVDTRSHPTRLETWGNTAVKGKVIPAQAYCRPRGFQEVEVPRFRDNRHMKVLKDVSPEHRPPLPTGNIPATHFC